MGRIVLLIASHLNVVERYQTMLYALRSVALNTRKPDHVYISYSVGHFDQSVDEWHKELIDVPHTFIRQTERLLQFEHYHILSKSVFDDDVVSFMDDDDLLDPAKFDVVEKHMKPNCVLRHKLVLFGECFGLPLNDFKQFADAKNRAIGNHRNEYFCLSIFGRLFKNWFAKTSEVIHGCTDFGFMISIVSHNTVVDIDDILYYYRQEPIARCYDKGRSVSTAGPMCPKTTDDS